MSARMADRRLVCSECRTEVCAAGVLMCENARKAGMEWVDAPKTTRRAGVPSAAAGRTDE